MKTFRKSFIKSVFLTLFIFINLLLLPVSAEMVNVTFVDPLGVNKISVYSFNGTHITDITSDSTYELNSSVDYVFHIQPNGTDLMKNPAIAFSWMMMLLPFTFVMFIVFGLVMMCLYIWKKGLRRF